jgi:hypothetical protein
VANPENIKQHEYKPGQSGNPAGRPKMPDLSEAIAKILNEEKDGKTALDAILAALRAKAAKGDVRAAQELLDRGFGKATQFIDFGITKEAVQNIFPSDDEIQLMIDEADAKEIKQ